jgi:hypothetical protein
VEALANVSDTYVRSVPGCIALRRQAQEYLAKRDADRIPDAVATALTALEARIKALEDVVGGNHAAPRSATKRAKR